MSTSLLRLIALAGVLGALVLILANPFNDSIRRDNPQQVDLFSGAETWDTIRIRVSGKDPVDLRRSQGSWMVGNPAFPADTALVANLLQTVGSARSSSVASTNAKNRAKFQVDSTGVEVVALSAEQTAAHFFVGSTGSDFTASYVRKEGENTVYSVRGVNRNQFNPPRGFRDLTLMAFDVARVDSVTRQGPDLSWTLTRADTSWLLTERGESPFLAREPVVNQVLRALSTLKADAFAEPIQAAATGLDSPTVTYTAYLKGGATPQVLFGIQDEEMRYYAARPDRQALYLVHEWRKHQLDVPREKFNPIPD